MIQLCKNCFKMYYYLQVATGSLSIWACFSLFAQCNVSRVAYRCREYVKLWMSLLILLLIDVNVLLVTQGPWHCLLCVIASDVGYFRWQTFSVVTIIYLPSCSYHGLVSRCLVEFITEFIKIKFHYFFFFLYQFYI